MGERGAHEWSAPERTLLEQILDQIIPASADGGIPSAGSLGVADYLSKKTGSEPDLQELLERGLACAAALVDAKGGDFSTLGTDDQRAVVEQLEAREPKSFEALLRHTYMAYYSNATVRPHFGLSANPTQPDGYQVPSDDPEELAALVEPVKNRGRCYREC